MADSTGRTLTYGEMLTGAHLLARAGCAAAPRRRWWACCCPRRWRGALANIVAHAARQGSGQPELHRRTRSHGSHAIEQCGIRTVITSRAFLAKAKIAAPARHWSTSRTCSRARRQGGQVARLAHRPLRCPRAGLRGGRTAGFARHRDLLQRHHRRPQGRDALALQPDLQYRRHRAAVLDRPAATASSGVLPFFHSFGLTVTIWFPLVTGCGVVYHPNPTDAARHRRTGAASTTARCCSPRPPSAPPTRASAAPEEFASLRFVLVGAEKLREPVAAAFREKFGVTLLEGYGCTEMSPVVAVNAPDFEAGQRLADRLPSRAPWATRCPAWPRGSWTR